MNFDKITEKTGIEVSQTVGSEFIHRLSRFLDPLTSILYLKMDRRLVGTLRELVGAIIRHRHNSNGLVLTELGGELLTQAQAPAGTKRIGNLLKNKRWSPADVEGFVEKNGLSQCENIRESGQQVLAIWDESVLEKPESIASEGLCSVRSSKAKRLLRIKPGYYSPPTGRPVHVPGFQWMGLILAGMVNTVAVLRFHWWTTRGEHAEQKQDLLQAWLAWAKEKLSRAWHVFDRGFCGGPWVGGLLAAQLSFVLRWKKGYKLTDENGKEKKAWQIAQGKRSKGRRKVWDSHRGCQVEVGMVYLPVRHPEHPDEQLYLVVCRPGKGKEPWYLLTNVALGSEKDAWEIIFAYARRWQIEAAYRFNKSELAIQSPRNKKLKYRLKVLSLVTLAYLFLLTFCMDKAMKNIKEWLLRTWCHRTGSKYEMAKVPLYRVRLALSELWTFIKFMDMSHSEITMLQNSG